MASSLKTKATTHTTIKPVYVFFLNYTKQTLTTLTTTTVYVVTTFANGDTRTHVVTAMTN
jgi:hypothetical protein